MTQTQYEGYSVNEHGDVFSTKFNKVRKLKQANLGDGYLQINISNNNKVKAIAVHRLVAETFIPNPQKKIDVNHKNGIKSDNRVENLEWNTRKENMKHAFSIGLLNPSNGKDNGNSKLIEQQVLEIRELYKIKKYNQRELGEIFGVHQYTISLIVNKKNWKHL
jgi:hypothetical protein